MAENKKSFIAYCDWKETFESLPDSDAGKLIKHLLRYVNDENPEPENILIKAVFASIKQTLKRDLKKYEELKEKRKIAGSQGGRPRKAKKANGFSQKQNEAKKPDSVSDSVSVSDSDIKEKPKGFIIPTIFEIREYCQERKNKIDASKFFDFYESKGWMVGKNKMKDWKAAVRTWEEPKQSETKKPKMPL